MNTDRLLIITFSKRKKMIQYIVSYYTKIIRQSIDGALLIMNDKKVKLDNVYARLAVVNIEYRETKGY